MKTLGAVALAIGTMTLATMAVAHDDGMSASRPTTDVRVSGEMMFGTKDIIDNAAKSADHTTLVAAVKAAGLVETLKGDGPFTVFAPTDEAFAKLPEGTLEALLADKERLTEILTYHVVAGKVTAAQVTGLDSATTLEGSALPIDTSAGVQVGDAKVVQADVMASNGVIHVIDTVLIPAS